MKNDGIIEKSTMPSVGELSFKPFHNTCVCDGEVPRNDAVARDPRPYDLMNMGVFLSLIHIWASGARAPIRISR